MKPTTERRSAMMKRSARVPALLALCALALMSAVVPLAACGAEDEPVGEPVHVHVDYVPQGPTSPEELIFLSDIVARVRLLSAEPGHLLYNGEPSPAFAFRFRVIEYLKGSGGDELTVRALAEYSQPSDFIYYPDAPTPDADAALRTAKSMLAQRDTRWDDREALVFLNPSDAPKEAGVYDFAWRYSGPVPLDRYAVTSADNKAWLPASAPYGDAALERGYLTYASSLSEIKSLIAANADMLAKGKDIPGYEECVKDMFKFDALYKKYPPRMSFNERRIPSGKPAGYRLWPIPAGGDPGFHYERWWTSGPDSDLFAHRITDDPDNDPTTGYATEHVALRPIPKGTYKVFVNNQPSLWVPCGYNPEATKKRRDMTIIATAPAGTLHEAFFDPVPMGGGAGADGANGVLKPAAFSLADGTSAALRSVLWRPFAVEMRLDPHARLSGYHADFIAMDGSVSLRLDFDDASEIGEGDSRALSWPVCIRRWQAGDMLMLRISESPPDLPGVTRDISCAAVPTATP